MRLLGAIAVGMTACTASDGEPGPGAFDPAYESSDEFFTLMDGPAASETVHGTMQIWYSVNLRPAIEAGGDFTAPVGSVAIKHQTQGDGTELVNSMVRLDDGASPDGLDWEWEQRDADGEVTASGAIELCVGCHQGFPAQDHLAGTAVR